VVGPFEVHSLDPSTSGGIFTRLQVAETLVDADGGGALRPGLASVWDVSEDGRTWRFKLRPGARFHDGTAVSADSVVASLDIARDHEGTPMASAPVKDVRAEAGAVLVELAEPYTALPAVMAHTSTQILAPSSYAADRSVTKVVGSGPYRVERIAQPSKVEVVASESWTGTKPAITRATYQAVGRSEARALMAQSGQADVTLGMDPVSLQRLKSSDTVDISAVTLPRTIMVKVNAGHEILGDVRVRRALSLALDRSAMATALLRDPEMAATQLFPPSMKEWHQPSVAPLEHDAAEAASLLADAGWAKGSDGMLTRGGRKLQITLRTFPDRPELPILATAIQDSLRRLGIALDVQVGNSSEIPAGHADGSLELGLYARNFALVPDPTVTLLGDFDPDGADWGAMGWSDASLTRSLQNLAGEGNAAGAGAERKRVAQILQRELPVIPVAWYRQSAVVSDRIDGFELDPLERSWRLAELRWAD
jgi:peptide/nickel transport system substrate-binding protein